MGRRVMTVPTWSAVAVANATNMVDAQHFSLKGGSATQRTYLLEVYCGGLATSSAPSILQLARHSTVGVTGMSLAGGSEEALDGAMADLAAPAVPYNTSTTKPQADATALLGSYAVNLFGGLVRKQWNPNEGPNVYSATASLGELGLNAFTGSTTGSLGTHFEYETI
jgi:hypothetical protein